MARSVGKKQKTIGVQPNSERLPLAYNWYMDEYAGVQDTHFKTLHEIIVFIENFGLYECEESTGIIYCNETPIFKYTISEKKFVLELFE